MKKLFPILVIAILAALAPVNAINYTSLSTAETSIEASIQDDTSVAEKPGFHQELKKIDLLKVDLALWELFFCV